MQANYRRCNDRGSLIVYGCSDFYYCVCVCVCFPNSGSENKFTTYDSFQDYPESLEKKNI